MKRGKKMILLLIALAVAIGGYFGVQGLNKKESVSETAGTFDLNVKKAEDLTGIGWTIGENTQAFRLENGVWETQDEASWPVKQETLQELADELTSLQATRKLEDVKNPGDYGLDTPAATVTAVWKNGTSMTYSMGDATPFDDGYYLSLSDQSETVYTISSSLSDLFGKTQKDLIAMEEIPAVTTVTGLKIGDALHLIRTDESKTVDPEQLWYDADTEEPIDNDQAESLVSKASSIAWSELETANADAEQLDGWMLSDEKAFAITLTGSENETKTILIGASKDDNSYYARLSGSSMVYTVKTDDVSSLMNVDKESLQIRAILPMPYESLVYAEFVTEKGTYTFEKKAAAGNPDETSEQVSEESVPEAQAEEAEEAQKKLWSQVTALKAVGAAENQAGEEVLSIRAVSTDGKECKVVFREYSAEAYAAAADDGKQRTVSADEIDAIIRTVRTLK